MFDRDLTDLGLDDYQPLYAAEVARRTAALRKVPRPRKPIDEHKPASRPDLHVARIYRQMGWVKHPQKRQACPTCLVGAGLPCVTDTGREMVGFHPRRAG